jgi:hypothetical protein
VDANKKYQGLVRYLDNLKTGELRPNPDVQRMVGYVDDQLMQGVTPSQLYTIRKVLTDGVKAAPTSELSQAARAARPQRMEIIGKIDDILDNLSEGQWRKYMKTYADVSKPIASKEAMQNIMRDMSVRTPLGETPKVIGESAGYPTVERLMRKYGEKKFGSQVFDRLLPEDRAVLRAISDDLYSSAQAMGMRAAPGSPTATYLQAGGRANTVADELAGMAVPKSAASALSLNALRDRASQLKQEQLIGMLQNPEMLARALERAKTAEALRQASRATGRASGVAAGQR